MCSSDPYSGDLNDNFCFTIFYCLALYIGTFMGTLSFGSIINFEIGMQIHKLLDIARSVASVNNCDYTTLEFMLERLEDLKYAIQDRKVDALVVETFGRCIEKLLQ